MMTPSELRQYEFKSAGRNAYKADDVDLFFGQVLVEYEKMYREKSELSKRIGLLADKLQQYREDEDNIKQAVLSAQKAADIIVRDAEESVADAKAEAEAILAAAKGEAQIIKEDAEKQAIADSDLLLSVARDKAEEILNKAKEKAHGILIAANDTANDKVGAATRTITSESLHYDMLRREVSEFRASILAQYKAHIELISKLPELADEEAAKIEPAPVSEPESVSDIERVAEAKELDASDNEDTVIEYIEVEDTEVCVENSLDVNDESLSLDDSTQVEDIDMDEAVDSSDEAVPSKDDNDGSDDEAIYADIPVSRHFSINSEDLSFDGFESNESEYENNVDEETVSQDVAVTDSEDVDDYENDEAPSVSSFFEAIESVETDATTENKPKKRFFFRKK